jgi:hypothetical protein
MRLGYGQKRQKGCTNRKREHAHQEHCESAFSRQEFQVLPAAEKCGRYQ